MKFLLDSVRRVSKEGALLLPKYDFVYAFLDVADFHNWQCGEREDSIVPVEYAAFKPGHLTPQCVPVGSVEFCLEWYRQMGVASVQPLNIPAYLDAFVKRQVIRTDKLVYNGRKYFGKSMDTIKSDTTGWYYEYDGATPMFFTEAVNDISSEWRMFVCNGEVRGIKCYAGSPLITPDMGYCREIVDAVQEQRILRAYTLDLMVQQSGNTDILELHDFFACGLYGFSDPTTLRQMALLTQRRLLGI